MKIIKFPFDVDKLFEKFVKYKNFPRNDFEKQAILIKILDDFKDNVKYKETDVNKILIKYDDYALLRRELVNFGYMKRDNVTSEYWVVKRVLTEDDVRNNTLLRRDAKCFKVLKEDE